MFGLFSRSENKIPAQNAAVDTYLIPLQKGYQEAFNKGEISEDGLAFARQKISTLRRKILQEGENLDPDCIPSLIKHIPYEVTDFTENELDFRKTQIETVYSSTIRAIENAMKDHALLLENQGDFSKLDSSRVSVNVKAEKELLQIFQKIKETQLQPLKGVLQHLDLLFCEPRENKSAGIVIFNRKISRSQKQILVDLCHAKIKECEQRMDEKMQLFATKEIGSLLLNRSGDYEMVDRSNS